MTEADSTGKRHSPETEIQVAAAAIAAAISPPLGIAVAAGSALRSRRVRQGLRKGTVNALAGAIKIGDQLAAAAAARTGEPPTQPPPAKPASNRRTSTADPEG
jgi:hypothetical protein